MFRVRSYGIQVRKWAHEYFSIKAHSNVPRVMPNCNHAQCNTDKQSWLHFRSSPYSYHGQRISKFNDLVVKEVPMLKTAVRQWIPPRISKDKQLFPHFKSSRYSYHDQRISKLIDLLNEVPMLKTAVRQWLPARIIKDKHLLHHFNSSCYSYGQIICMFGVFVVKQPSKLIHHNKRLVAASVQQSSFVFYLYRPIVIFFGFVLAKITKTWPTQEVTIRRKYLKKMRQRWLTLVGTIVGFGIVSLLSYLSALAESHMRNRLRLMLLSDVRMGDYSRSLADRLVHKYQGKVLPRGHALRNRVVRVAYKLLDINQDMTGTRRWRFYVIESNSRNAFILPDGSFFVFTGLFKLIRNDHQLAFVLAHELAHIIKGHTADQLSKLSLYEMILLHPDVVLWSIFPRVSALLFYLLSSYMTAVLFLLPNSREVELEADEIGIKLAAKACFDGHQALLLLKRARHMSKEDRYIKSPIEWTSEHPKFDTRIEAMTKLMLTACHARAQSKCSRLRYPDPCFRFGGGKRKPHH